MEHIQNGEAGVLVRSKINSAILKAAELKWYSDALKAKVGVDRLDIFNSIFADGTPGFRINIEEAIRLNQQALGPEIFPDLDLSDAAWEHENVATVTADSFSVLYTGSLRTAAVEIGKVYAIKISGILSGTGEFHLMNGGTVEGTQPEYRVYTTSTAGRFSGTFTWRAVHNTIRLRLSASTVSVSSLKLSVREIDMSKCVAFQDLAGTLPVTAMEQPLGLILDTKLGVPVRGAELFSDAQVTFVGESSRVSPGAYRLYSSAGAYSLIDKLATTTIGKWYEVVFTVDSVAAAGGGMLFEGVAVSPTIPGTVGQKRYIVQAAASGLGIKRSAGTTDIQISGVSVREVPGNHFIQPNNTANRPVVSRRVNLLTNSEFSGSVNNIPGWSMPSGTNITPNVAVAPDGKTKAALFTNTPGSNSYISSGPVPTLSSSDQWVRTLKVKAAPAFTNNTIVFEGVGAVGGTGGALSFDTKTGVFSGALTGPDDYSATPLGDGWWLVRIVATSTDTKVVRGVIYVGAHGNTPEDAGVYICDADLRLSIDANLPHYQRVTSPTDYDEVGFPAYARFDGLDDWLESGVVDMTSTDEVAVIAGVTKLSDAGNQYIYETTTNSGTTDGAFSLLVPDGPNYRVRSRGTVEVAQTSSPVFPAPRKDLLTQVSKIGDDLLRLRVNGEQAISVSTDQGTGNYGAHKCYMGRRGGTTLPFNGRIYGVTVIGKLLTDGQLAAAEYTERNLWRLY